MARSTFCISIGGETLVRSSAGLPVRPVSKTTAHQPRPRPAPPPRSVTISRPLDSSRSPGEPPLGAWQWYPASTHEQSTGTLCRPLPPELGRAQRCVQSVVGCEAFRFPILPGDYQEGKLPGGGVRWRLANPHRRPPLEPVAAAEAGRKHAGLRSPTTTLRLVHFRDDGARSTPYLPAHRAAARASAKRWRLIQAPSRGVLPGGAAQSQPLAEGEGQWCLAVPPGPAGVEVLALQPLGSRGDATGNLRSPSARDARFHQRQRTGAATAGEQASAALALRFGWSRGAEIELPLVDRAGDLPLTGAFATGQGALRRYTDHFGAGGGQRRGDFAPPRP